MRGRIPDSFIDELLARVDIVEVIEARVPLKRAGRDWTARCPFHDERTPSFTVSPAKQFYHCFGCGAHGSAIKFLMEYDRLEFRDAVEELAARVGLTVPDLGGRAPAADGGADLYTVLDEAATFYQREIRRSERVRAYLERRGLDPASIERFRLGYAPAAWETLKTALGTTPQRLALLEKAGLLASGERGSKYDRFRDRLMFPIHDRRGRVIAFGGRAVEPSSEAGPKYLNSPETPLFHKGRELYALWQVRQKHGKIPRLIVVEGYLDVIALFQHGIDQAVATLGTATTREHAELLFRNSADVYFCFDGDRAGRQAAWRAVEAVLPRMRDGRQAFFLFLPEGEDPDTLVRKEGRTGFEQRLRESMPLSEFFFAELGKDVRLASLDGKARLAERARPMLSQIPDGAFRDLMLGELQRRTEVRLAVAPPSPPRGAEPPGARTLVRTAVALLLQNPGFALAVQPPHVFSALRRPGIPLLVELIALCRSRPEISTAMILEHYAERDERRALQRLAVMPFPGDEATLRAEFLAALAQLDRQTDIQRRDELEAKVRAVGLAGLSAAEKDELRALQTRIAGSSRDGARGVT
jgi:DNA primase